MQIIKIKCQHSFCTNMFRSPRHTLNLKKKRQFSCYHPMKEKKRIKIGSEKNFSERIIKKLTVVSF